MKGTSQGLLATEFHCVAARRSERKVKMCDGSLHGFAVMDDVRALL